MKTVLYDPAEDLTTPSDQVDLLADAFASGDQNYITNALQTIARARGMACIATEAGISRATIYKALGKHGDPRLSTLLSLMQALGLSLSVAPKVAS